MKKNLTLMAVCALIMNVHAQTGCKPPVFSFNNLTSSTGSGGVNSSYKFSNVVSGVDAVITITKAQNAQTSNAYIDVAGNYPIAWQPYITFPAARNSVSDTSYLEFRIEFKSSSAPFKLIDENCMAMTIVDCDGAGSANSYREMVKVSLPGTPKGVVNSTISVFQDARWILYKSGPAVFNTIDTLNAAAMGQTNFPTTVNTFYMRIGVVGPVSANLQRQFSFYFKSFSSLVAALPVNIFNYRSETVGRDAWVRWSSSDEQQIDRYEIYRSFDGQNFDLLGSVKAKNAQQWNEYAFADPNAAAYLQNKAYYKLRTMEMDGHGSWGGISMVSFTTANSGLLTLFPNPASDQLGIDLGDIAGEDLRVSITDVCGKSVTGEMFPGAGDKLYHMDISSLEKGMYFVNIRDVYNNKSYSQRFIKY